MKPFLYQVAELFYEKYASDITTVSFVFPNRRAGIFFQKYLAEISQKPIFSPEILTINDLFLKLSNLQLADNIGLLFEIYDVYVSISHSSESFDDFVFWGEMLLSDFNDVDKYLADAKQLFTNVTDIKEIDKHFSFLTEDQIDAIRRFWSNFIPVGEDQQKKDFLQIWEILYPIYTELKTRLLQKNIGYEGLIYREVVERMKSDTDMELPFSTVVFVGFNALTEAEKIVMSVLKNNGLADFYWDYDHAWVQDKENKASFFRTENLLKFPSKFPLKKDADSVDKQPEFELIGLPSAVGQAKEAYQILKRLCEDKSITDASTAINTAIVLPNENLLMPVLHSIPEEIRRINITMGYPLRETPVSGLLEYIIDMQRNIRTSHGEPVFYHKYVLPILNHRYISFFAMEESSAFTTEIQRNNLFFINKEAIPKHPVFALIFTIPENATAASDYLLRLLEYLQQAVPDTQNDDDEPLKFSQIEKEFIYRYYLTVNRMKELLAEPNAPEMSTDLYFRLLKKMIATISIPFVGEPLSGLQIMGTLETRALDFDNIIILSMNEGVYPKRDSIHSFIPYNLRKGFELPNNEHQDAIFAYNFYRMIGSAKRVFFLYDTRSDGLQTGEVSRFVYQLKYHYRIPLKERLLTFDIKLNPSETISIDKNEHVTQQLQRFLAGGEKALSASAINTYINCPFKFYLSYVEGLAEENEVTETIEANTFGSIFHQVMQDIYDPLAGRLIQDDVLLKIKKDDALLTGYIEKAFAKYFRRNKKTEKLTGQNYLVGEIIRKYVKQMLDIDRKKTPFTYMQSEKDMQLSIVLSSQKEVRLKGFIDRIDNINGVIRILDYKTGMGKQTFKNIPQLFDKEIENRPKDLMQVLMYCLLYQKDTSTDAVIEPGIFYLRNLFSPQFDTCITQKEGDGIIEDFASCKDEFEAAFKACLDEIFSADTPFRQTNNHKQCEYCPFTEICGR